MFGYSAFVNGGRAETIGALDEVIEWGKKLLIPGYGLADGLADSGVLPPIAPVVLGPIVGPAVASALSGSQTATVTAPSGLKVRAAANENSAQLALLPQGTAVTVLKTGFAATAAAPKGWTQVRTASGTEGFMSTEWLSISSPTSASSGNTSAPSSPSLSLVNTSTSTGGGSSKLPWIAGGVAALVLGIGLAVGLSGKSKRQQNPSRRRRSKRRARR